MYIHSLCIRFAQIKSPNTKANTPWKSHKLTMNEKHMLYNYLWLWEGLKDSPGLVLGGVDGLVERVGHHTDNHSGNVEQLKGIRKFFFKP